MRQHALNTTGVELSAIGLGGVWFREGDAAATDSVLGASLEAGVNWVDTAEGYGDGDNESAIGEALRSVPRMQVASKVSWWRTPLRRDDVHRACRASLQRLQRDVLDVYFVHHPSPDVALDETWGAMCELQDQGLVRAIGLSNFSIDDVRRTHEAHQVDIVQDGLSLIDHLAGREHFSECAGLGIAGVAYEPVAGGLLTGAISSDSDVSRASGVGRVLRPAVRAGPIRTESHRRRQSASAGQRVGLHDGAAGYRLVSAPAWGHGCARWHQERRSHDRKRAGK